MRISSAALLLIAACSPDAPDTNRIVAEAEQQVAAAENGRILCARGEAAFARTCTVEQTQRQGGLVLTVRHPDGGFHRLQVIGDGRGVVAADGAEPARVTITGPGEIDVAIGDSRYRLPATVKAQ